MDTQIIETATEVADVAVKEANGLAKFNKFGWGFLGGLGAAGLIGGLAYGGKKLWDKHQEKKAAESKPKSKTKNEDQEPEEE